MQQPEEFANKQQQKTATKLTILCKTVTSSLQISIYISGYYFREEGFTSSFISIIISIGLFLLLEALYWYKRCQANLSFHKGLTLLLHSDAIIGILGIGLTFKHTVINPSQHYFFFEFGLLFNYGFSIIQLFTIYSNPAPQNTPNFLALLCPVPDTLWYLCVGLYVGALLDYLTSSIDSYLLFYIMNSMLALYLIVKFASSKGVVYFRQAFASE